MNTSDGFKAPLVASRWFCGYPHDLEVSQVGIDSSSAKPTVNYLICYQVLPILVYQVKLKPVGC